MAMKIFVFGVKQNPNCSATKLWVILSKSIFLWSTVRHAMNFNFTNWILMTNARIGTKLCSMESFFLSLDTPSTVFIWREVFSNFLISTPKPLSIDDYVWKLSTISFSFHYIWAFIKPGDIPLSSPQYYLSIFRFDFLATLECTAGRKVSSLSLEVSRLHFMFISNILKRLVDSRHTFQCAWTNSITEINILLNENRR